MVTQQSFLPVVLNRLHLSAILEKENGRFVTVEFTKQNGEHRVLNGRLGVTKHLVGGVNKTATSERPYVTVFDVQEKGYRTVNLETTLKVRASGIEYLVS